MKNILLTLSLVLLTSPIFAASQQNTLRKPIYIDNYSNTDVQYAYQVLGSYKWEGPYTIPANTDVQLVQPSLTLYDTPRYWEFWMAGTNCKYGKIMTITGAHLENFNLIDILPNNNSAIINPINRDGGGPYGERIECFN
jgi:hypothetical protein